MGAYLPVADQLKILFDAVRHPDGRPYTLQEVSEATGVALATISHMRSGRIQNPLLSTLREIARFFDVPLRYFEAKTPEECYGLLTQENTALPLVNEIAFRASSLSPRAQRDILTLIKWVQAAEQQRKTGGDVPPLPNLEGYDEPEGAE